MTLESRITSALEENRGTPASSMALTLAGSRVTLTGRIMSALTGSGMALYPWRKMRRPPVVKSHLKHPEIQNR